MYKIYAFCYLKYTHYLHTKFLFANYVYVYVFIRYLYMRTGKLSAPVLKADLFVC